MRTRGVTRALFSWLLLFLAMSSLAGEGQQAEFDGYCAYSLSQGGEMKTACDVVWISPEDKLYCFMNEAAKATFIKDASRNLRKAKAFWEDPAYWERLKAEEGS